MLECRGVMVNWRESGGSCEDVQQDAESQSAEAGVDLVRRDDAE